jgi:hypothetical protein
MEAICSSEKSVETQRTTWRHISEDGTLPSVSSHSLQYGLVWALEVFTVTPVQHVFQCVYQLLLKYLFYHLL